VRPRSRSPYSRLANSRQALFARNAKVYMACRTQSRAEQAIKELHAEVPTSTGELIFLPLDLADLASVRRAATEFMKCVSSNKSRCRN
jgi:NAD(P)-dependent dehydrogenase (short-subunit alcohol dehydrogenase family)